MHKKCRLFLVAVVALLLTSVATAVEPIQWQPTLDSAKRLAAQTDRLVLIHFWAGWCGACRRMEQTILSRPEVAAAVQAGYVPVKINRDYFPATCRQYGVTALPCQLILTPEGRVLEQFRGVIPPGECVARLNRVSAAFKVQRAGQFAENRSPAVQAPQAHPPQIPSATAGLSGSVPAPPTHRASQAATRDIHPPVSPVSIPIGQTNPPLGLDGYCPVQLIDDMQSNRHQWTLGDRRWGAIHRGRTYLFCSSEHQRRFLADPDRYAPVISGNDIVLAVDRQQNVQGRREWGVLFRNKVYLFAGEESLERFSASPNHYAEAIQAMRASASRGRGLH